MTDYDVLRECLDSDYNDLKDYFDDHEITISKSVHHILKLFMRMRYLEKGYDKLDRKWKVSAGALATHFLVWLAAVLGGIHMVFGSQFFITILAAGSVLVTTLGIPVLIIEALQFIQLNRNIESTSKLLMEAQGKLIKPNKEHT